MAGGDNCWMFLFTVIFLTSNLLFYLIRRYMNNKPLGSQSLYDVMMRDNFLVVQVQDSPKSTNKKTA